MNRMAAGFVTVLSTLSTLALPALRAPAPAQTADAFYKGKQIRFIVGTASG